MKIFLRLIIGRVLQWSAVPGKEFSVRGSWGAEVRRCGGAEVLGCGGAREQNTDAHERIVHNKLLTPEP
jgi:hypothetical protein